MDRGSTSTGERSVEVASSRACAHRLQQFDMRSTTSRCTLGFSHTSLNIWGESSIESPAPAASCLQFSHPHPFSCADRSLDAVIWAQLPEVTAEVKALCEKLPAGLPLTGDIAHTITLEAPEPEEGEEPAEPPTITEDARLAVAVNTIEMECALAPVGALMSNPLDGHVKANPNYKGLDLAAAQSLSSYVFLNCQTPSSALSGSQPMDRLESLASADSAVPAGSLCTRIDESTGTIQVRSLLWPGHVTYVKLGTPAHGYCYFGNGVKNTDIAFMLP